MLIKAVVGSEHCLSKEVPNLQHRTCSFLNQIKSLCDYKINYNTIMDRKHRSGALVHNKTILRL